MISSPRLVMANPLDSGLLRAAIPAGDAQRITCEHADRCGGCPIIALPYGEQLALKRGRVVQSVGRYAALELVYVEPVSPAEPIIEYRTRAKMIVGPGAKIGLFAKGGGHQVVDIPGCRVVSPVIARVTELLRNRVTGDAEAGGVLAPFDPSGGGALRALDLREVRDGGAETARVLVTLVIQRSRSAGIDSLRAAAESLAAQAPEILGISVNFHDGDAPQILGSETCVLFGVASAPDRLGASTHLATYGSFVQAHRAQAARVHEILAESLGIARQCDQGAPPRILDLYGGSGAIALGLAAAGARVHLIESFAPAVAHARSAAEAQSLTMTAECGDVAGALRSLLERQERFDAAVVNPPRRGMSAGAREWLARLEPQTIAYVSCDPDTLARDLDHLQRLGYASSILRPLDMIPLTDEVETVAILRRTSVPAPRVVFEDDDVLVVEKGPHEPTAPQPEYAGSLVARARRIPGAEEAVPVHRIDVGTSGLVILAKRPEAAPMWAEALAAPTTRKIYVAATRGVTPSKGAITRELREDGKLYPARTRAPRDPGAGANAPDPQAPGGHRPPRPRRRSLRTCAHQPLLRGEERPRSRLLALRAHRDRSPPHRPPPHGGGAAPGRPPRGARAHQRPRDTALPRSQERARHHRQRVQLAAAARLPPRLGERPRRGRQRAHAPPGDDRGRRRARERPFQRRFLSHGS
jgi:23S rRNA (uracil1939-C5)-methyltransferase